MIFLAQNYPIILFRHLNTFFGLIYGFPFLFITRYFFVKIMFGHRRLPILYHISNDDKELLILYHMGNDHKELLILYHVGNEHKELLILHHMVDDHKEVLILYHHGNIITERISSLFLSVKFLSFS